MAEIATRVYYRPGRSSCAKTKELLSSWGVTFEGVDVEAHPERKRELEPHGVPRVPATIHGDRAVHGWNPKALAEPAEPLVVAEGTQRSPSLFELDESAVVIYVDEGSVPPAITHTTAADCH